MKRILTILLTSLVLFTLVGCNDKMEEKPDTTPVVEVDEPSNQEEGIVGGFVEAEDPTITDELKEIFNSGLEGLLGAKYEPVKLLATQVVNGINYKFLANGTKTTNPITIGTYNITINKSSDGTVSLIDIETIEEKQDDSREEFLKNCNYWVVFYNPDGNELDRQAIKYGTIPTYQGEDPVFWDSDYWYNFVCWTDKQGNEIKEFKPITGNTYIYAKYEIGGVNKPVEMCTVTFIVDGDSYAPITVSKGSKISDPSNGTYKWKCNGDDYWDFDSDVVNSNITLEGEPNCLAEGALINMADGTKKAVEFVKPGDAVLAYNHYLGKVEETIIAANYEYVEKKMDGFTLLFDNGSSVRVTGGHAFFEKEANKYVVVTKANYQNYIGHYFYDAISGSWVKFIDVELIDEPVRTFILSTYGDINCIVDDMLCNEDGEYLAFINVFDFKDNLAYDEKDIKDSIEKYGLWYLDEQDYITQEMIDDGLGYLYDAFNLKYFNIMEGKGLFGLKTTKDIIVESHDSAEEFIY